MKLTIVTALLSLSLAACGGKSKPAETGGGGGEATERVAADCCCEFIEETGEGDEMAENQVRRMMTGQECEQNTGTCIADADPASCNGPDMPPTE